MMPPPRTNTGPSGSDIASTAQRETRLDERLDTLQFELDADAVREQQELLAALGWNARQQLRRLARHLGVDERLARRWWNGQKVAPASVRGWLRLKAATALSIDDVQPDDLPAGWVPKSRGGWCMLSPGHEPILPSCDQSPEGALDIVARTLSRPPEALLAMGWRPVRVEVATRHLALDGRWFLPVYSTMGPSHLLELTHCRRSQEEAELAASAIAGRPWSELHAERWEIIKAFILIDRQHIEVDAYCGISEGGAVNLQSCAETEEAAQDALVTQYGERDALGWYVGPIAIGPRIDLDLDFERRWLLHVFITSGPDHLWRVQHCRRTEAETTDAAAAETGQPWRDLHGAGWRVVKAIVLIERDVIFPSGMPEIDMEMDGGG